MTGRIYYLKGSPGEVGLSLGHMIGKRLEENIHRYISVSAQTASIAVQLEIDALPWVDSLPERYREEIEGISDGSGISMQHLAEWYYVSLITDGGCTAVIFQIGDQVWVARNNDMWAPELWGYACIREISGRIPTVTFGMEGDVFTGTGINREHLWLHYNYLPVNDAPATDKLHYPAWVWLTEALETCSNLSDVEILLSQVDRNSGMKLFAVEGKSNDYAVYDCSCSDYCSRRNPGNWIAGTNHYHVNEFRSEQDEEYTHSVNRLDRVNELIKNISTADPLNLHMELRKVIADDQVEARGERYFTVYSNIVCPVLGDIWYTFGGYPAASEGNWQRLPWPW